MAEAMTSMQRCLSKSEGYDSHLSAGVWVCQWDNLNIVEYLELQLAQGNQQS